MNTEKIMQFESGELGQEDTLALFAELVETGDVWCLPSCYVTAAAHLIENNLLDGVSNNVRVLQ